MRSRLAFFHPVVSPPSILQVFLDVDELEREKPHPPVLPPKGLFMDPVRLGMSLVLILEVGFE